MTAGTSGQQEARKGVVQQTAQEADLMSVQETLPHAKVHGIPGAPI